MLSTYFLSFFRIRDSHPDEAQLVMDRTAKLRKEWEELNSMLHDREAKLEEAGDLHRFLKDLDHFQVSFSRKRCNIGGVICKLSDFYSRLAPRQLISVWLLVVPIIKQLFKRLSAVLILDFHGLY